MTTPLARILILLPVLWLTPALASAKHTKKAAPGLESLAKVDFTHPVATIATPERNVAIFQLIGAEAHDWSYMIVRVDSDGTRITYGDENTVGPVIKELTTTLLPKSRGDQGRTTASVGSKSLISLAAPSERTDNRCAVSTGWRFETTGGRVNYCSDGFETARIERAIDLLDTAPEAEQLTAN